MDFLHQRSPHLFKAQILRCLVDRLDKDKVAGFAYAHVHAMRHEDVSLIAAKNIAQRLRKA